MSIFTKALLGLLLAVVLYWSLADEELSPHALAGRKVLITGASSGIGEQLAYHYSRLGASVVVTARREEQLNKVVAKCKLLGDPNQVHAAVRADLGKEGEATMLVNKAVDLLGGVDQLVINHAWIIPGNLFQGSQDELKLSRGVMDVNFHSSLELTGTALPFLEKHTGSIGIVSSLTAKFPSGGVFLLPYVASKAALSHFFEGLRHEFQMTKKNVSVTVAHIGLTETSQARSVWVGLTKKGFKMDEIEKAVGPATPADSAFAILKATTLRKDEVYFPHPTKLYLLNVLTAISPRLVDAIESYMGLQELTNENTT